MPHTCLPYACVALLDRDIRGLLDGIASICTAVIWPLVVIMILWMFRSEVADLFKAAVSVAYGANRFRIWQIEFDRDVQQQVQRSESAALESPAAAAHLAVPDTQLSTPIPAGELSAASRVRSLLEAAPNTTLRKEMEEAIRTRMLGFAQEYETVRASMHAGPDRTRAMNGVVAKMRTLALAADLFADEWMADANSPGRRLAAICILQLKPRMEAVPWLVERMKVERPFVFFHASVALLNTVRRFGAAQRSVLEPPLQAALKQVQSFGEKADTNTIRSLTLAISELDTPS